jgi:4-amino-4-deoxy-L-arabinose transferase-like glycosyltransferase
MDDLRLFRAQPKSSEEDPPSNPSREYVVYVFFFVAVTPIIAVWTHWSVQRADLGIATEVLFGFSCADWLIVQENARRFNSVQFRELFNSLSWESASGRVSIVRTPRTMTRWIFRLTTTKN